MPAPTSTADDETDPLLAVDHLSVAFPTATGPAYAVEDVSFELRRGEVLGLVGESGSGKSMTALAIIGLTPPTAELGGTIDFAGVPVHSVGDAHLQRLRGDAIGTIFQDPLSSLNPLMKIGDQLVEAIRIHDRKRPKGECREHAVELLDRVGIKRPQDRLGVYPHELSGGMRQRVMIAVAVANAPDLIVADEPTTALDVTTQSQVLTTLTEIRRSVDAAMILITHDLGLVSDRCDRVGVMYNGRIVELGDRHDVLRRPQHPYTIGLLETRPTLATPRGSLSAIPGTPPRITDRFDGCAFAPRCDRRDGLEACVTKVPELEVHEANTQTVACHRAQPVALRGESHPWGSSTRPDREAAVPALDVTGLVKVYPVGRGRGADQLRAVDDVSFSVPVGRTLALVGESGSGKTTVARSVLRLVEPTAGSIRLGETDVRSLGRRKLREFRSRAQIIFQDPTASLNPRRTVGELIAEPMLEQGLLRRSEKRARVGELLDMVALFPEHATRYPNELSGGQRQRVSIARALGLEPELLVLDEPVSALDVSIQSQVLGLLGDLQRRLDVSYLFVSHDLGVVKQLADEIAVMQRGRIVELGPADTVLATPRHPYTQLLLASVPGSGGVSARELDVDSGFASDSSGCGFADRCPHAEAACVESVPQLVEVTDGHAVACRRTDVTATSGPVSVSEPSVGVAR